MEGRVLIALIDPTYHGRIESWRFDSKLADFSMLIQDEEAYHGDISEWDVSHVTDMSYTNFLFLISSRVFDQDIGNWKVSLLADI
jgi:bacterial surface protein 26-residue repeat